MVVGESRQFNILLSSGVGTVDGYTCKYSLKGGLKYSKEESCPMTADKRGFTVKFQTANMRPGNYILRVTITDTVEDYTKVYYEEQIILVD